MSPAPQPARIPLQFTPWTKEQLASDDGINFFNEQWQQVINTLNQATGNAGRVQIPSGIDVAGSTVTGLGAPKNPSDAVSAGHANANYGAGSVGPELDIGGSSTLKGLSALYLNLGPVALGQAFSGTITLAKLTSGGSNGSITVKNGIIVSVVQPS